MASERTPWEMTIQFQTDPETFRVVRRSITSALRTAGLSESRTLDVEVAVGEILSNAYVHAYGQKPGLLAIDLKFDGDQFVLLIHDHGKPLTAIPEIPQTLPRPTGTGGRGLYLVGQLMDAAEILHPGPTGLGTAVRIVKRIR